MTAPSLRATYQLAKNRGGNMRPVNQATYKEVRGVALAMLAERKHGAGPEHASMCRFLREGLAKLRIAYYQ